MKTIRIELDYMDGPIWKDFYNVTTKSDTTGVPIVDNDEKLKAIAHEISSMYDSYYIIDEKEGVYFNYE